MNSATIFRSLTELEKMRTAQSAGSQCMVDLCYSLRDDGASLEEAELKAIVSEARRSRTCHFPQFAGSLGV